MHRTSMHELPALAKKVQQGGPKWSPSKSRWGTAGSVTGSLGLVQPAWRAAFISRFFLVHC